MGGSSAETAAEIGAAHFLSTAAFAGNRTNTGLRIVRFFESMGAKILSAADKEKVLLLNCPSPLYLFLSFLVLSQIVYEVKVLPDRVNDAVAALISILSTPPHAKYVVSVTFPASYTRLF